MWSTTDEIELLLAIWEEQFDGFHGKTSAKNGEWNKLVEYYNKKASRRGFGKKQVLN